MVLRALAAVAVGLLKVSVLLAAVWIPSLSWAADVDFEYYNGINRVVHTWPVNHPSCGLFAQSPIDISSQAAEFDPRLKPIRVVHQANNTFRVHISKTSLHLKTDESVTFQVGDSTTLHLKDLHLHWGADNSSGSEHTFDGKAFAAEMHLVTGYNGVLTAVIGIVIKVGNYNHEFHRISQAIKAGNNSRVEFSLHELLRPIDLRKYYRYQGSLTTPPCSEKVLWTVARDMLQIAPDQIDNLRNLNTIDGKKMINNYRETLALNPDSELTYKRVLTASFSSNSASSFLISKDI